MAVPFLFASCDQDDGSNPTLKEPGTFVLNTPALASGTYDLENSKTVEFTCNQPDYGFPAATTYYVQASFSEDMSDAAELSTAYTSTRISVDASDFAALLTQAAVDKGYTEDQFPITEKVYVRVRATLGNGHGDALSNTITLNSVKIAFSLPPVYAPESLYIIGGFNGNDWKSALSMVQVNGATNTLWHLVYIDGSGITLNDVNSDDGSLITFSELTVTDNAGAGVTGNGGTLAVDNPGWYLLVVTTSVEGRTIVYDVQVNKPEVYLTGIAAGGWDFFDQTNMFSVPTAADGEFVSPTFVAASDADGVRACVKIGEYNWWASEFMVFNGVIEYRGNGGDQERVQGRAGQKLYLNFTSETGRIE